ncbi:class I adenylate-forming enzyme family protein [Nonomuraea sp. NPDC003727]
MTTAPDLPPLPEVETYLDGVVDLDADARTPVSAGRIAHELTGRGIRAGELVLIRMPNGTALLACFFGVLFAGGIPALLPLSTPTPRVRELAAALGARLLIVPRGAVAPVPGERQGVGVVDCVRLPHVEPERYERDDVVLLTSGTSGTHSACLHRVSSLLLNARRHAESVGLRSSDTVLVNLPLNFSYALVAQALAGLLTGSRLVLSPPLLSPAAYATVLADHRITSSSLTPYLVRTLLTPDGWRTGSLRMLTVGGDALEPENARRLLRQASDLELYLTYGLTEAGPRVSTLAAHREPAERLSSVGRPLDGVRVTLRAPDENGVGELLVTSDTVMRRRLGIVEGRSDRAPVDHRQLVTGDLFSIDGDGYLYFCGRRSEGVVAHGHKVALSSVRRIADTVPGVAWSATRPYRADGGETWYELDLYVREPEPHEVERLKRAVLRLLARAEWPARITVLPAYGRTHK